jgi:hypothetical protein
MAIAMASANIDEMLKAETKIETRKMGIKAVTADCRVD